MHQTEPRPWREVVGGMWDEIGALQLQFLVAQGLRPEHRLLDVGCGCLRGGVHLIRYLDPGRYYGMEKEKFLLDAGRQHELGQKDLEYRRPNFSCRDDFNFSVFEASFDYAIAQSVFTHQPWNSILRCLFNMQKVLSVQGKFYATFFEDTDGSHKDSSILHTPGSTVTCPDRDPFHYEYSVFAELAARVDLGVEYVGDWGHPRAQKMMVFTHRK